jgi:serine/threonine protein phosphatase 1
LLLDAFLGDDYNNYFLDQGGIQMLESFRVDHVRNIPLEYIRFFRELPYFIERDNYLFVHAGFDFSRTNPFENLDAMLVIRDFYTEPNRLDHKTIIHGHNPIPYPDIKYILDNSNLEYIPLDAGCVYVDRPGLGNLCIIRLNDLKVWVQPCIDCFSI